ncbi:M23 family metallopeptidase [Streptomyces galilaeus]
MRPRPMGRAGWAAALTALLMTAGLCASTPAASAASTARPDFRLPFPCGQTWQLQTYLGHDPDDKKLDMYHVDGPTLGAAVTASAAGTVTEFFEPGGIEINHGGGWFSVYLHMDRIDVHLGQQVASGDPVGRLGLVGTEEAHLHYEQLYDTNGDNDGETDEMVHPVLQGTEYRLTPDGPFPRVTSTNACDGGEGSRPGTGWTPSPTPPAIPTPTARTTAHRGAPPRAPCARAPTTSCAGSGATRYGSARPTTTGGC